MTKRIFLLMVTAVITSCAGSGKPPEPAYSLSYEFVSDKNYQYVYRFILNKSNTCIKHVGLSKSISEGQIYNELKAADINIMQQSPLGKYPHIKVAIESRDTGTKVTVTNDFETWDKFAKSIKSWIVDESASCE